MAYIPELDGLRAVAVFLVFLNHAANRYFPGAFIGVDIFFVLSGYLITSILQCEVAETGRVNLRNFYIRRALRLAPALLAMLSTYSLFVVVAHWGWKVGDQAHVSSHLYAALSSAAYFMDYTAALGIGPQGYLLHTWSLAVEEQFYILWPITMCMLLWRVGGTPWRVVLALILAVMAWRTTLWFGGTPSAQRIYCAFDTRLDTLLFGCLLALAPAEALNGLRRPAVRFLLIPIAALAIASVTLRWDRPFYQAVAMPVIGGCAAWLVFGVLALSGTNSFLCALLRRPSVNYLGRISYGFYLWHYPICLVMEEHYSGAPKVAIAGLSTLAVATLSYRLIELPLLNLRTEYQAGARGLWSRPRIPPPSGAGRLSAPPLRPSVTPNDSRED